MNDHNNLKLLYSEIIKGRSSFFYNKKNYYIKHFNYLDSADIDMYRSQCIDKGISNGLSTYNERLSEITKDKTWSEEKEHRLNEVKDFVANLKHTKSKYTLDKDKKIIDKDIAKHTDEYISLVLEKNKLIGKTAEQFAEKKVNEYYIYHSIYKDEKCHNKMYDKEEFDELEQYILDKLYIAYNAKMSIFSGDILKKIALMPVFMNLYILSDNNPYRFFGKPLIELTFYQIEMLQNGKNFKYILENAKTQPPPEIMDNPDKLMEWFHASESVNKVIDSTEKNVVNNSEKETLVSAVSVVGAKKEDYEKFGVDNQENNAIMDKLKTKGELSWQDLI